MQITLDESFAPGSRADLTRVAEGVLAVVRSQIPGDPPQGDRPIVCFRKDGPPRVRWPARQPKQYEINLNVGGRFYNQFTYQLGHELGHVMMDPSRTNGVIESLATLVSLQALEDMERRWATHPPFENWRGYAKHFGSYRENTIDGELAKLPPEIATAVKDGDWDAVSGYLLSERKTLIADACHRPLNHLAAVYLLHQGIPWPELRGIAGRTVPPPAQDPKFRSDLQIVPAQVPDWLTAVWARST